MTARRSDALVFFGATGDLAYKQIFPALQALIWHGHLEVPIVGVAKSNWNLDQFKAQAKDSLEKHGQLDPAAYIRCRTPRRNGTTRRVESFCLSQPTKDAVGCP